MQLVRDSSCIRWMTILISNRTRPALFSRSRNGACCRAGRIDLSPEPWLIESEEDAERLVEILVDQSHEVFSRSSDGGAFSLIQGQGTGLTRAGGNLASNRVNGTEPDRQSWEPR